MITLKSSRPAQILPQQSEPWIVSSGVVMYKGTPAKADFYRSSDAPSQALDLIWHRPRSTSEIYRTTQARVERCGEFVLKTIHDKFDKERWGRIVGLGALAMNVALQQGLDDNSVSENGYKVVTPRYYAALLIPGRHAAKWVMSYEHGEKVTKENQNMLPSSEDRKQIYDDALSKVGIPPEASWYDDGNYNLLIRQEQHEIVKLDALSSWTHEAIMAVEGS